MNCGKHWCFGGKLTSSYSMIILNKQKLSFNNEKLILSRFYSILLIFKTDPLKKLLLANGQKRSNRPY